MKRVMTRLAAAATFTTLLAAGTVRLADAAQAATPTAAGITSGGVSESFNLPAGVNAVRVGAGHTQAVVTRSAGVSPQDFVPCTLSVSNPVYNSGSVQSTATIRCAYPTGIYLEVGLSYNGGAPVANGQSFAPNYSASLTVSRSAAPGYYRAYTVSVLDDGQQYGYYYSNNVYIPQ